MDSLLDLMGAVLMARLDRENQINAIFDRKIQTTTSYPYGELFGPLPREVTRQPLVVRDPPSGEWKWELSFKEDMVRWLAQLQWTTQGHVTFVELALDFEATAARALPAAPASRLCGQVLSLHERARVLRVAMTVLSRHVTSGVLYQGGMTCRASSLVPLGAGVMAGLTARPYFASRVEMSMQLRALKAYCEERHAARMAVAPRRSVRTYRPPAPTPLAALAPRVQAPNGQEGGRALDARGGSTKRTTTFAANYVPLAGGRPSTALPYAPTRPTRKIRQQCEEHDREACDVCKARKLGVRKCCAAGHHREGYVRRKYEATRRTLYCLAHGQPACHSCRSQHKGSQHCCALGHHLGFSPRKYRRRAHAPERPLTPAAADAPPPSSTHVISDGEYDSLGAPLALSVGDNKHVVISDDSDCEAWSTPALLAMATPSATERADKRPRAPPATAVPRQPPQGPAGHNGALPASTGPRQIPQIHQGPASRARAPPAVTTTLTSTSIRTTSLTHERTDKRPRATPLAVPSSCDAVPSTSPETLPSPSKRPRAGNRGEAMGADSPLLARPRSGNTAQDPQPKRHRGSVRCPPLRHESAPLDQDLEPIFHPSFSSSFAIGDIPQLPLAGAGRARRLAPPSGHGRACESNT